MEKSDSLEMGLCIERAMIKFSDAMEKRDKLSNRIGQRTTQIIRASLIGMILLGIALALLIYVLQKDLHTITQQMTVMSNSVESMNTSFGTLLSKIEQINTTMISMEKTFKVVGQDLHALRGDMLVTNQYLEKMNKTMLSLPLMKQDVKQMKTALQQMTTSVGHLTYTVDYLSSSIGSMTSDVNTMTKPMRWMPFP